MARAAIAAMREPTNEMLKDNFWANEEILSGWENMIDNALKEGK